MFKDHYTKDGLYFVQLLVEDNWLNTSGFLWIKDKDMSYCTVK